MLSFAYPTTFIDNIINKEDILLCDDESISVLNIANIDNCNKFLNLLYIHEDTYLNSKDFSYVTTLVIINCEVKISLCNLVKLQKIILIGNTKLSLSDLVLPSLYSIYFSGDVDTYHKLYLTNVYACLLHSFQYNAINVKVIIIGGLYKSLDLIDNNIIDVDTLDVNIFPSIKHINNYPKVNKFTRYIKYLSFYIKYEKYLNNIKHIIEESSVEELNLSIETILPNDTQFITPHLKVLIIRISEDITTLPRFIAPRLQELNIILEENEINLLDIIDISQLTCLFINNISQLTAGQYSKLEKLIISNPYNDKCYSFPNLKYLELLAGQVIIDSTNDSTINISKYTNLQSIKLYGNRITFNCNSWNSLKELILFDCFQLDILNDELLLENLEILHISTSDKLKYFNTPNITNLKLIVYNGYIDHEYIKSHQITNLIIDKVHDKYENKFIEFMSSSALYFNILESLYLPYVYNIKGLFNSIPLTLNYLNFFIINDSDIDLYNLTSIHTIVIRYNISSHDNHITITNKEIRYKSARKVVDINEY